MLTINQKVLVVKQHIHSYIRQYKKIDITDGRFINRIKRKCNFTVQGITIDTAIARLIEQNIIKKTSPTEYAEKTL